MALVIVGVETLDTVTVLPLRSAVPRLEPGFQLVAPARLKVVPPVELVPFLFKNRLTDALSLLPSVTVKLVPLVTSTLLLSAVRVKVVPPSPVKLSLVASTSLVVPDFWFRPVPVTTSTPVEAL